MERWSGRVALVTGASAGIGEAIVRELVLKGMKVVGAARRVERVEALQADLGHAPGQLFPLRCDVTKEDDVLAAFAWIKKNLGGVDVLINNAGVIHEAKLDDGSTDKWRHILEVNLLGLSVCTREALRSMQERAVDDGHIIHINSVAGHYVVNMVGLGMYNASKFGVTALTEALRKELVALKSKIRVTSLSPGAVRTDIMEVSGARFLDFDSMPHLQSQDIADAVTYVLGTPAHVQIHELTIRPVGEAF